MESVCHNGEGERQQAGMTACFVSRGHTARPLRPLTLTTPEALEDSLPWICTINDTTQQQHTENGIEHRA